MIFKIVAAEIMAVMADKIDFFRFGYYIWTFDLNLEFFGNFFKQKNLGFNHLKKNFLDNLSHCLQAHEKN